MISAFNIDPRLHRVHLRPVKEHWREPSDSKGLGIAEAVAGELKGKAMNQHLHPDAAQFLRQQPAVVAYARELYEAAVAADADWDSPRSPYRQERLEKAWDAMQRVMGNG